jgi:hypothetical protein
MKLAAGYIVFDGLETLENSIKSVRDSVDLVIVSYQTVSWGNTLCSESLVPTLVSLKEKGLIDELLEFKEFSPSKLITPEQVLEAKSYERNKRQSTLDLAIRLGATHYLSMDADEFYLKSQFEKAKQIIVSEKLEATAVRYINYVTPTLHRGLSQWKVPFIYDISKFQKHSNDQIIFGGIDPTRGLHSSDKFIKSKIFSVDDIVMHHMEMVRDNILEKYTASSRFFPDRSVISTLENDVNESKATGKMMFASERFGESYTNKGRDLTKCDDLFGLLPN